MIAAIFALRFTMYVAMAFAATSGLATWFYFRDAARFAPGSEAHKAETRGGSKTFIAFVLCVSWVLACRSVLPLVTP